MSLPRFVRWALESLYPAGGDPWSSTATKVQPPFDIVTPGVPVGAQIRNYVYNALGESVALVATAPMGQMTATTPVASITGGAALDTFAYDDGGGLWLAAGHSADNLVASPDNGLSWTSVATPASQVNAIGVFAAGGYTPNNGVLILGGASNVFFYSAATGSLIDSGSSQGVTFNGGGAAFGLPTNTLGVFGFSYDATNHRTRGFVCTGSASYTALTLPATWQIGPQTNIKYFTYGIGPSLDALVAWGGTTPGVDTSYILHMAAATFPTTPTFTALVLPAGISTGAVTGVAYNATSGLYGAMVYDGTHSALWTTADLSTWTKHADFLPAGVCGGLQTIGPYWVTTAKRGGVPASTAYTPVYSFDGDTWRRSAGTAILSVPKLAAGPGCIATWDTNDAMVSAMRIG